MQTCRSAFVWVVNTIQTSLLVPLLTRALPCSAGRWPLPRAHRAPAVLPFCGLLVGSKVLHGGGGGGGGGGQLARPAGSQRLSAAAGPGVCGDERVKPSAPQEGAAHPRARCSLQQLRFRGQVRDHLSRASGNGRRGGRERREAEAAGCALGPSAPSLTHLLTPPGHPEPAPYFLRLCGAQNPPCPIPAALPQCPHPQPPSPITKFPGRTLRPRCRKLGVLGGLGKRHQAPSQGSVPTLGSGWTQRWSLLRAHRLVLTAFPPLGSPEKTSVQIFLMSERHQKTDAEVHGGAAARKRAKRLKFLLFGRESGATGYGSVRPGEVLEMMGHRCVPTEGAFPEICLAATTPARLGLRAAAAKFFQEKGAGN